jgi:8-oxo-dGTP pyrophosphatase MutT (NUDIX family)
VLIPLFEEDGEVRLILTKRPDTMSSHQGEIAFPGGKFDDATDGDLRDAALREAQEEIGLEPALVDVVAELDHLATVASRFHLAPFVGLLDGRPALTPDPDEVASVFDVALSELLDDTVFREEHWEFPPGTFPGDPRAPGAGLEETPTERAMLRQIYFFELDGETVWGATARILTGLLVRLTAPTAGYPQRADDKWRT